MTTWNDVETFGECSECTGGQMPCNCGQPECDGRTDCRLCDGTGLAYWDEVTAREAVELTGKFADAGECLVLQLARAVAHGRAPAGSETQRCFAILLGVES